MDCPIKTQENMDWLLDYAAGRLGPAQSALLARHVETCPACARFVEGQQLVWSALSQWEPRPVSADFDRRLYRRIESKPESRLGRWFGPLQPLWRPVVPLAAACLLIVAGVVLHIPRAPLSIGDAPMRMERIEPEQVERTLDDMQMLRELGITPQPEENTPGKSM
jgi:anti-sigma factor RsiW